MPTRNGNGSVRLAFGMMLLLATPGLWAQQASPVPLYVMPQGVQSRWTSPENPSGAKGEGAKANEIKASGAPMRVISVGGGNKFYPLLYEKHPPALDSNNFPKSWVNYYRSDLWSAVAYFYLNAPTDNLPTIAPVEERLRGIFSWPSK